MQNDHNKLILMCGDQAVMGIDFNYGIYEVYNKVLLPYQLKNRLIEHYNANDRMELSRAIMTNYDAFIGFLAGRVLSLDRKNAKEILNSLNLTQSQSVNEKAKISILCRAVSVLDNYWVKSERDNTRWSEVNLRSNPLNQIVAQVALHGTSLTLEGRVSTPEISTHGAYAKCWKREEGKLYLLKAGNKQGLEPKLEIQASRVLSKCNVKSLRYEPAESEGVFCSKCECMTNDHVSMLDARDFSEYGKRNYMDARKAAFELDADSMYKMGIADYLIGNSDRHDGNWGFYYDSKTTRILGCHPLYDHNNAFNAYLLSNDDAKYLFNGESMLEYAKYCMKHVNFRVLSSIKKSDFYYEEHYESVQKRAAKLGLSLPVD